MNLSRPRLLCRLAIAILLFVFPGTVALRQAAGQTQPPQAVNEQNELVHIGEPQADHNGVLRIFRSGDKSQINRYISQVVELKSARAFELLPYVLQVVQLENGTARTLEYKDPAAKRTRYFLQVVTTTDQMPSVLDTIKKIDLPGVESSEGDLKYAVRMRNRKASEVAQVLANTSTSGQGQVYADDPSNTLWIDDSQSDGARSIEYIKFYDVPPPQVEFDVQVCEISESDAGQIGLDWDAWKRSLGGQIVLTGNAFEGGGGTFSRLDWLVTLDARTLAEFLNYTTQKGTAKTIQRCRITGSNLIPAQLSTTKRVSSPDYVRTAGSSSDPKVVTETTPGVSAAGEGKGSGPRTVTITPQAQFTRVDNGTAQEGIEIVIQPTIGTDLVTAQVSMTVASIDKDNQLDQPIVASRQLDTVATLKEGEPFLLGSLRRETSNRYRRGIPGLRKIPVVKHLFSVESVNKEATLFFAIATPTYKNHLAYAARSLRGSTFDVSPPLRPEPLPLAQEALAELAKLVDGGPIDREPSGNAGD